MERSDVEGILKELNIFMLTSIVLGLICVAIIVRELMHILGFFIGSVLGYINFHTLRKEGRELLYKVYQNVMACVERPYQKERTLFLIKVYLRLLALAIIFYFLMAKLKLHPVSLLAGFTLVYLQIFVVMFRYWLRSRESY